MREGEVVVLRAAAEERVRSKYSWEKVTDRYEFLFEGLKKGRGIEDIGEHLEKTIPLEPVERKPIRTALPTPQMEVLTHG